MPLVNLQLGKKGLTQEFLVNLKRIFDSTENVRISLLKSSSRNRQEEKLWAEEIVNSLGKNYTAKIVGYTIVIRKWRKARK